MIFVSSNKEFHFSASHELPEHPGKCKELHGHNYKVQISAGGDLHDLARGMILDFDVIDQHAFDIVMKYDHTHLNNWEEFSTLEAPPTAEVLAVHILLELRAISAMYRSVRVYETDSCWAEAEA